jgi:uncharacterized membrane protein YhhN
VVLVWRLLLLGHPFITQAGVVVPQEAEPAELRVMVAVGLAAGAGAKGLLELPIRAAVRAAPAFLLARVIMAALA